MAPAETADLCDSFVSAMTLVYLIYTLYSCTSFWLSEEVVKQVI